MSIPSYQQLTINHNPGGQKGSRGAAWKGSWPYWENSVQRLNVFADENLKVGKIDGGRIDFATRLSAYHVFKCFLARYDNVTEWEKRPFNASQEAEIRRLLSGGFISRI